MNGIGLMGFIFIIAGIPFFLLGTPENPLFFVLSIPLLLIGSLGLIDDLFLDEKITKTILELDRIKEEDNKH